MSQVQPWDVPEGFCQVPARLLTPSFTAGLTRLQLRLLLAILRGSLGWQRKTMQFSIASLARSLGSDRSNVAKALQGLRDKGLVAFHTSQQVFHNDSQGCGKPTTTLWQINHTPVANQPRFVELTVANEPHKEEINKELNNKGGTSLYGKPDSTSRAESSNPPVSHSSENLRPVSGGEAGVRPEMVLVRRSSVEAGLGRLFSILSVGRKVQPLASEYVSAFYEAAHKRRWSEADLQRVLARAGQEFKFWPTVPELLELGKGITKGVPEPKQAVEPVSPQEIIKMCQEIWARYDSEEKCPKSNDSAA